MKSVLFSLIDIVLTEFEHHIKRHKVAAKNWLTIGANYETINWHKLMGKFDYIFPKSKLFFP